MQASPTISPGERNPETSTLSTSTVAGTLMNVPGPFVAGMPTNSSFVATDDDDRATINVSPPPDAEQMRQQALAQMLAEDPAPMWRPRARTRSRSRRRCAVDGGA
ncbi:uncharacterized protein PHACADRAFT_255077 [Phanerochaete carnosa HHB-10118-sp]|uniref:Uncharacterized protein n=1 Tax=Phanerochaete carnosa (strain HHB-10118-sp) TaxID=650164 RepID=K5X3J4_PHACS|nr:uncharacterized protein PHACADRAFT_255077 [Phanerochaete carnosa HHB-10118-sp]EKM57362.1 hypothetical protein PHACADRAFT_255077 [Phanerochaete carnosa HHB-10118-sp]